MARINATIKGGYYPYPPEHIAAVAGLFGVATKGGPTSWGRILDPCAGEGEALKMLATALTLTPYANELDDERASACREKFGPTQAVQGDLMTLRTSHNAYVMQWVNPPYARNTGGTEEQRRELEFLKHAWDWTQPGGYTLWVVYAHHVTDRAARFLLTHSTRVDVYRVPGLHLNTYPQIVVVARKAATTHDAAGEAVLALTTSCQNPDTLPLLTARAEPVYRLPEPARVRRFHFHPDAITPDVMLPAIEEFGAHHTNGFQNVVAPPPPPPPLAPIVPPRGGQLGLILAAGLFDGLMLDLPEDETNGKGGGTTPAAVRGVVRMIEVDTTPPGMEGVRETVEIRPQATVTLLYRTGRTTTIAGADEAALIRFIKDNRKAFLAYLDAHSTPVYDFDYTALNGMFANVFQNRQLPGRPSSGLFETQKHVTAAAYAALMGRKGVIIIGEMGVGKSAIGATLAGALHANGHVRPGEVAVVMCPPHLVNKWKREARDAIPDCYVEIVNDVDDTVAFMARAAERPDRLHVAILSREKAKLGEGWEPAYVVRKEHVARWATGSPPPYHLKDKPRILTQTHLCCPTCGEPIPTKKDGSGAASRAWLKKQPRTCYRCGAPLWQLKRRWSGPREGEKFPRRNPRYPLARLLRDRYRDRIGVAVIDELHELKGGGSDQGRAMQDLALIARKVVGLTGTLFGGTASSVFWLEWAFNPRMVRQYPLDGGRAAAINRWVRATGVLEKVIEYKEDNVRGGAYSGVRRIEHAPKEIPGISPRLVSELIDHCVWVGLSDLNFALPDYTEIPVEVHLPSPAQAEYDRAKGRMLDYLMACRTEGDASFLSTYLQAVLRYPSSCFRPKPVIHRKRERDDDGDLIERHVVTMKSFGEEQVYPKEEALCDLLARELAEGRRCAVFVAQTGTLDIQPRLLALIEERIPDAKPFILRSSSPATDKRDAHIEQKVEDGHNILIVNPRLIQTGLDLVAFPTLIFYETDYSLYVMSQASRRSWRIGQTDECRVYYLYYADTMEAQAIGLISRKQAAAALLGGDADGGGLAQLAGGANSLLAELAKAVAEDEAVVDVTQLFRRKAAQSEDFTSGWATGAAASQPPTPPQAVDDHVLPTTLPDAYARFRETRAPDTLTFIEMTDDYVCFDQNAQTASRALHRPTHTFKQPNGPLVAYLTIPKAKPDYYFRRLHRSNHTITLVNGRIEQLHPPTIPEKEDAAPAPQPHVGQRKERDDAVQLALF